MIEIKIPADIHAYKSKLIFGFTTRQVIAVAASVAIAVPLALYGKKYLGEDVLGWTVILTVAPVIAWGFFTYKDMKFEDFIRAWLMYNLDSQKRVYEDTDLNIFHRLNEEINEIEIVEQKLDNGELNSKIVWRDEI